MLEKTLLLCYNSLNEQRKMRKSSLDLRIFFAFQEVI